MTDWPDGAHILALSADCAVGRVVDAAAGLEHGDGPAGGVLDPALHALCLLFSPTRGVNDALCFLRENTHYMFICFHTCVERLYCKRPIQCLASSEILTSHPLTARRVCIPPPVVRGEDTLAGKTPDTALYSICILYKYFVHGFSPFSGILH